MQAKKYLHVQQTQTSGTYSHSINKEDDILLKYSGVIIANHGSLAVNYDIDRKIGSGTFGKVYEVTYRPLNQKRAMKVVKKDTINYQDDAQKFLALGADRLGTSRIVKIVKNEEASGY